MVKFTKFSFCKKILDKIGIPNVIKVNVQIWWRRLYIERNILLFWAGGEALRGTRYFEFT